MRWNPKRSPQSDEAGYSVEAGIEHAVSLASFACAAGLSEGLQDRN